MHIYLPSRFSGMILLTFVCMTCFAQQPAYLQAMYFEVSNEVIDGLAFDQAEAVCEAGRGCLLDFSAKRRGRKTVTFECRDRGLPVVEGASFDPNLFNNLPELQPAWRILNGKRTGTFFGEVIIFNGSMPVKERKASLVIWCTPVVKPAPPRSQ